MRTTDLRLAYMANQIALNLAVRGDRVAAAELADHLAAFWDPVMKARILALDESSLSPIALAAVELLRARGATATGLPPPIGAPADDAGSDARSGGSDAG